MAEDKKTEGLDKEEQKSKAKKMRQDLNGNELGEMTDDDYDAFKTSSLEYERSLDGGDGPQPTIDELIAQMVEEGATDDEIIEELRMRFDFSDDELQALQEPTLSGEPSAFDLAHAQYKEPDDAEYDELEQLARDAGFTLNDKGEYADEEGSIYTVDLLRQLRDAANAEAPAEGESNFVDINPNAAKNLTTAQLLTQIQALPPEAQKELLLAMGNAVQPGTPMLRPEDVTGTDASVDELNGTGGWEAEGDNRGNALAKLIGSLKF